MNIGDLIMNIRETYKECDKRLERNYRLEFDNYSSGKLEKIWEVIQEHHNFAKAPELGNIFKYMNITGVGRTKDLGDYYNRCTQKDKNGVECGTKYSLRSKMCPVCNATSDAHKPIMNSIEIVKATTMPHDLFILKDYCGTCKKYQMNRHIRGAKCSAWGSHDDYKKTSMKCDGCPCYDCCNEKPKKGFKIPEIKRV